MTEATTATIESLLKHHMAESARDREERAARDERIFAKLGQFENSLRTVQSKVVELEAHDRRQEEKIDRTHALARKAMDSNADLEGVVMRELGSVAMAVASVRADNVEQNRVLKHQNEQLADIKAGTESLVEADKFRRKEAEAWAKRRTATTEALKTTLLAIALLSSIGGAAWAAFEFLVKHAR